MLRASPRSGGVHHYRSLKRQSFESSRRHGDNDNNGSMEPKYSSRLQWSTAPNALSVAIDKRRTSGLPLLDLTQSNPTAAGIEYPSGLHAGLADERVLRYEPSAIGLASAREAVSSYYSGRVDPDRILLTASTSEAYAYLFKLLCNPGDEVLIPQPSYPLLDMLAQLECVQVTSYPLRYHDGWFIDLPALRDAVTERTRAIVWVNPNNPTGSYLKRQEYDAIAKMCVDQGLALISDEVFGDYVLEAEADSLRTLTALSQCLCFSLSGLSKICGLPQMKLGWMVASGPGHEQALHRLEWISDTFLSVGTPVQCAAPVLLDARHGIQRQIKKRTLNNLGYLRSVVVNTPCRVLRVEGGWYATIQVPRRRTEEAWTLDLLGGGVIVQPGYFFDFAEEAFLVVSLLTEPAVFRAGVQHILEAC
jgi:alanine-synthesizing transaminase